MKKFYLSGTAVFLSAVLFAQSGAPLLNGSPVLVNGREGAKPVKASHQISNPVPEALQTIVVDYDAAESARVGTDYSYFYWNMNQYYTTSGQRSCVVAFDSLYDVNTMTAYDYANVTSVTVDTVFALIGHENNSGLNDTITVSIIPVNAAGYPQISATPLWSDQVISNTGLSANNGWLDAPYVYQKGAGLALGTGVKKFAVMLQYRGSTQDTMAFVAGFEKTMGSCGTSTYSVQNPSTFFTRGGVYSANSFAVWAAYASYGTLPTSTGIDVYYDCDGSNTLTHPPDGYSYIQNIGIWVKLTINVAAGVEELSSNGLKLLQNNPNPAKGVTMIAYEVSKNSNISIEVFDVAGKRVMNLEQGQKAAGRYKVELPVNNLEPGLYFYSLVNGSGDKLTKKLIVVE